MTHTQASPSHSRPSSFTLFAAATAFALAASLSIAHAARLNGGAQTPVIGILSSPNEESDPAQGSFITDHYVKFLEAAGARVVPVVYDQSRESLDALQSKLNGILFTGGGLTLAEDSTYYQAAKRIYENAKRYTDSGNPFTLWGTCMGFQLLHILGSGSNHSVLLEHAYDSYYVSLPLTLTPAAKKSFLFDVDEIPAKLFNAFQTENITLNLHHDGVDPAAYEENPELGSAFTILSTNVDLKGKPFVSTFEAKKYPFYGAQWHPERPMFTWHPSENVIHNDRTIEAGLWMARRIVESARRSKSSFESDEEIPLIERDVPVHNLYSNIYYYKQSTN